MEKLIGTSTNITLNNNAAECIKAESDFTVTVYHNICNGTQSVVPTGVVDYMLGIPLILIVVVLAVFCVVGVYKIIFD
jgi:ABC-type antimicrobial peptide transport system permease subunit